MGNQALRDFERKKGYGLNTNQVNCEIKNGIRLLKKRVKGQKIVQRAGGVNMVDIRSPHNRYPATANQSQPNKIFIRVLSVLPGPWNMDGFSIIIAREDIRCIMGYL